MSENARDHLRQEWQRMAPNWIREMREGRNAPRRGLLDRAMLEVCGDVRGLRVLDSGCGEGRFCRMLLEQGASYVLGVDLCEPMINAAKDLQGSGDEYRVDNVENLEFLDNCSFDLAVSYLNQCDLADADANTREVIRVLKPGGRFIVCNVHPMRSAVGRWQFEADGTKSHFVLDKYCDEGARVWRMLDLPFTNFHRTLATLVNGFLAEGFQLLKLMEPVPTADESARYPKESADELRVPNFIIISLIKA